MTAKTSALKNANPKGKKTKPAANATTAVETTEKKTKKVIGLASELGLGNKKLNDLLGDTIFEPSRKDMPSIDIRLIKSDESFNCRVDYGNIEELMQSIIANGQIEPITVYKPKGSEFYYITDGFRRYRAIMMALDQGHEIKTVLCKAGEQNIERRFIEMFITGTQKKNLNEVEQASVLDNLNKRGYEPQDLVAKLGLSRNKVDTLLALASTPIKVQKLVAAGKISGSTVVAITKQVDDEAEQLKIINQAIDTAEKERKEKNGTTSGKATKRHLKNTPVAQESPLENLRKAALAVLEEGVTGVAEKRANIALNLVDLLDSKKTTFDDMLAYFKK